MPASSSEPPPSVIYLIANIGSLSNTVSSTRYSCWHARQYCPTVPHQPPTPPRLTTMRSRIMQRPSSKSLSLIQHTASITTFKSLLKTYLFRQAYSLKLESINQSINLYLYSAKPHPKVSQSSLYTQEKPNRTLEAKQSVTVPRKNLISLIS